MILCLNQLQGALQSLQSCSTYQGKLDCHQIFISPKKIRNQILIQIDLQLAISQDFSKKRFLLLKCCYIYKNSNVDPFKYWPHKIVKNQLKYMLTGIISRKIKVI